MSRVYKILPMTDWEDAVRKGVFLGSAVDLKDGFIHFSTAAQALETAAKRFAGQAGLVLAAFEAEDLGPGLKFEPSRGGDLFPHLYGPLDPALALGVVPLALGADGVPVIEL